MGLLLDDKVTATVINLVVIIPALSHGLIAVPGPASFPRGLLYCKARYVDVLRAAL